MQCVTTFREHLEKLNPRHIFWVAGGRRSVDANPASQPYQAILKNYPYTRFSSFDANPSWGDLKKGLAVFHACKPDVVVALGGGSVLDMAKLIALMSQQAGDLKALVLDQTRIQTHALPVIAIPTTAGSGSEATAFAVLYINQTKYSVAHPSMLPAEVILDARLTHGLPAAITASTGIDALCQAIESFWSCRATPASQADSEFAIREILKHIVPAVCAPTPLHRAAMLLAAHHAGRAINITKTTAPHALSYWLTQTFGMPHGHAVALSLPYFFEFNTQVTAESAQDTRGVVYIKDTMAQLFDMMGVQSGAEAKAYFLELMHSIGLETRFEKIGLDSEAKRTAWLRGVNQVRLSNHPRKIASSDWVHVFSEIFFLK